MNFYTQVLSKVGYSNGLTAPYAALACVYGMLANFKIMNYLSHSSEGCYARDRCPGGGLSQLWPQLFENTLFVRAVFARRIHRGLIEAFALRRRFSSEMS